MASIYHLNNPPLSPFDASTAGLDDNSFHMFGGRHGRHGHHHSPPFWGWEGPAEHGHHGRRGHHGHHAHGRLGGRRHGEGNNIQQSQEPEVSRAAEENAGSTPSTETLNGQPREHNADTPSSSDSENECRLGRKDKHKHKGFHGAGKGGRGGKGCKGRHGDGRGHKGRAGKFGGHHGAHGGPHVFGHPHMHPHHPFGHPGPFHGRDHHRGHPGRGMWHGDFSGPEFHESMQLHHDAMRLHHEAIRHHHMAQHVAKRQMRSRFGYPVPATQSEFDFVPVVDVFDTPTNYIVHVSLPGAKRSDISVEYLAEESVLCLSGIVRRPGMTEEVYQTLAMEERSAEIGTFERVVRLGTRQAPAPVLVDGFVAKLEDGVLVVTIAKTEEQETRKTIPVECDSCEEQDIDGTSKEMDSMVLDEHPGEDMATPGSEESELELEDKGFVKIPVQ